MNQEGRQKPGKYRVSLAWVGKVEIRVTLQFFHAIYVLHVGAGCRIGTGLHSLGIKQAEIVSDLMITIKLR